MKTTALRPRSANQRRKVCSEQHAQGEQRPNETAELFDRVQRINSNNNRVRGFTLVRFPMSVSVRIGSSPHL